MSSEPSQPRAVVRWSIRTLPFVGLVVGVVRGDGVLGAVVGLVVGYVAALAVAFVVGCVIAVRARVRPAVPAAPDRAPAPDASPAPATAAATAPAPVPVPVPARAPALVLEPSADVVAAQLGVDRDALVRALDRAVARHGGVLNGRFVLTGGELRAVWGSPAGGEVSVVVDDTGADRSTQRVPVERVSRPLRISSFATHVRGAVLELLPAGDGGVRAIWWRGENADRMETIPVGFLWEKNDDYMHGVVDEADLGPVTLRLRAR
ncbi:hypothetical protein [Cellulomonas sp.]|uniref:hypothetical protein n=1 Tax=Cellulomonas sp. TaxID=40001 RepID=UPI001B29CFB6|nr:hypothetical protein [Cellulomonas sp.]MBO9555532.1 hypothetical protein [Cellulomonas sp.]